jgi:rare lipoprotein A
MELGDVRYIIGLVLASVALPASGDTNLVVRPERGEASYYWQFKTTASGETHDPEAVTCAHKTLAFNTRVRVTNLRNGSSVICRVNDRGPFTPKRIIDLSLAGARAIGMIETGIAPVSLEILQRDHQAYRSDTLPADTSEGRPAMPAQ